MRKYFSYSFFYLPISKSTIDLINRLHIQGNTAHFGWTKRPIENVYQNGKRKKSYMYVLYTYIYIPTYKNPYVCNEWTSHSTFRKNENQITKIREKAKIHRKKRELKEKKSCMFSIAVLLPRHSVCDWLV